MKRNVLALLLAGFVGGTTAPAVAGDGPLGLGLLKRKPKADPAAKAKQLVATLQSDPDERKRKSAAEELREFDPRNNPDVLPALIGSLQKDPSAAVRIETAQTIGKLKPVSQPAGIAMETAFQSDPDIKVREAVQAALWQYHLNGYRTPPTGSTLTSQTPEPPIATARPGTVAAKPGPKPTTPSEGAFRPIANAVGKGANYQPTVEPPLAKPKAPAPAPTELPKPKPANEVLSPTPVPSVSIPPAPVVPTPAPSVPSTPLPPIAIPSGPPTVPVPPPIK